MGYDDSHEHYDYVEQRDFDSLRYDVRRLEQQLEVERARVDELLRELARR
jgi:hypothetical protein